jgi:exodeoxyribonuclease VII small subunit
MARGKKKTGFDEQLHELEEIVTRIERGDLPLEESLDLFERGIRLSRDLQAALQSASLRVTRLLEGEDLKEVPHPSGDPVEDDPPVDGPGEDGP